MPGTASDVAFTFDPGAVLGGVKKINQSMTNMTRQVAQGAQSMAKSVSRGILRAAAIVGSLKAAVAGVRNLMKRMPEVSQAFDIARDVIFKNLLWPLRQRVMPMLQRMLDWVRDNRETFARWGQVVANVFDIVVKGVRRAVDAVRALWERAGMLLGRIFGDGTQSIEETMNLLTAKLAVTMEFVGGVIRRVMDWIVGLVERNLPAVAQLLSNIVGTVRMLAERYGGMILSGIERIIEFVLDLANKHWPAFEAALVATGDLIARWIGRWGPGILAWIDDAVGFILDQWTRNVIPTLEAALTVFDNMFVRSGALASLWETVKTAVDAAVQSVRAFLNGLNTRASEIGSNIRGVFDSVRGVIQDMMTPTEGGYTILTFFQRVGEAASNVLSTLTAIIDGFAAGFRRGIEGIQEPLSRIVEAFNRIWRLVFGDNGGLKSFFENVGEWIGEGLMAVLGMIELVLRGIEETVRFIQRFFNETWPELREKLGIGAPSADSGRMTAGDFYQTWLNPLRGGPVAELVRRLTDDTAGLRNPKRVDDALITKRGEVVQFSPDDNIFATKGAPFGASVTVSLAGMNVSVSGSDPYVVGQQLGEGIGDQLRSILHGEQQRMGR